MFYGREQQKKSLLNMIGKEEQMISLIYGRRRIGKSELIKQTLKETNVQSIYYECKQTTEQNNVDSLATILADIFHFPKPVFSDIEEILDFLFKKSEEMPLILVFDEYPYLRENVKGLDSIIQSMIDKYKDTSHLKFIICGSYVDTMKELLAKQNPLYGRVDLTIELKPMDYYETALFYEGFSNEDKVRLYSVFGGIPYYNRLVDAKKSVRENIIELIASPGARLENEVSMYLNSEISKITNANEVFEALSKGFSRYKDILDQSNVSSGPTLVDVLDKLIKMDVVKKEAPINDEDNKKKAGYFISDNLSLFFYKYIFRNMSRMQIMDSEVFYDKYIEEDFETKHVPKIFEDICKQYLIRKNKSGNIEEVFEKIGKYYYDDPVNKRNGEFDIVTLDDKGYVFYEAKFRKEPITESMIKEEIFQVKQSGLACYKYGFISKSGFKCEKKEDRVLITLDELYV
ncbi:MAG: ATP-binding protein [Agathobacter sp.]